MSYFVFSQHCWEVVSFEGFDTKHEAAERIASVMRCDCGQAKVHVVEGQELEIVPVEVVTKVELRRKP